MSLINCLNCIERCFTGNEGVDDDEDTDGTDGDDEADLDDQEDSDEAKVKQAAKPSKSGKAVDSEALRRSLTDLIASTAAGSSTTGQSTEVFFSVSLLLYAHCTAKRVNKSQVLTFLAFPSR